MANIYNSQLDAFTLYHQYQDTPSSSAKSTALPALGHAISGATGTAISNLCLYPLDLIITRLQVQRTLANSPCSFTKTRKYTSLADAFERVYNEEGGIAGFYSGVLQDTSKSIADSFLFFLFYGYIRSKRLQSHHSSLKATLPAIEELGVGALAGGLSKFFTTPLSNIVVRKQTHSMTSSAFSKPPTISSIISDIREKKGIAGFWSGYSASLILTLNPSLTFFLYEFLKRVLIPRNKRDDPGARITFLLAAFSKAIASSVTYPISLAKARAQVDGSLPSPVKKEAIEDISDKLQDAEKNGSKNSAKKAKKYISEASKRARRTIIHSILKIYREEGIAGLYEGIGGEIIKGFLGHGLTMIVKNRVHELILSLYFMVLRLLKKAPSPEEVLSDAKETILEVSENLALKVRERGEDVLQNLKTGSETALQSAPARETGAEVTSIAQDSTSTITQSATNVNKTVVNGVEDLGRKASASLPTTKETAERAGVIGNNVTEKVKSTNEYVNKEAGHLLGNAGEQLGERIEGLGGEVKRVGKGVKD